MSIAEAPQCELALGDLDDDVCIFCDQCRRIFCDGHDADVEDGEILDDEEPATCAECIEIDELAGVCPWCGAER